MKNTILMGLLVLISSCGSSEKKAREFELEYKVVNASTRVEPDWLSDASKYKGSKATRYFVSESKHAVKRLCVKSSTARAMASVASEIQQEIRNEYSEVTRQDQDKNIERYFSETLKQIVDAQISGIRVINQYWEKRKFLSNSKGGNVLEYACFSLVGISEKRIERAIKVSRNKFKKVMNK